MIAPLTFPKFLGGWLPALAVSASVPPTAPLGVFQIAGLEIPLITCILGAIGILAARPLARKKEATLGLGKFILVSAVMLVAVELWIVESHPGWLFAFVVAIGLGFSGYSLIELLGEEIKGLVKSAFELARSKISSVLGGSKNKGISDE